MIKVIRNTDGPYSWKCEHARPQYKVKPWDLTLCKECCELLVAGAQVVDAKTGKVGMPR